MAIVALPGTASLALGVLTVVSIALPVMVIAASAGTWLFYVQHQFERTYWEHTPRWSYVLAASFGTAALNLWDEDRHRLVSFREAKRAAESASRKARTAENTAAEPRTPRQI